MVTKLVITLGVQTEEVSFPDSGVLKINLVLNASERSKKIHHIIDETDEGLEIRLFCDAISL
tara:strand:+ start:2782 stop:2967 length:186 start_codon:yes stop_codon:yes gene_type:complete